MHDRPSAPTRIRWLLIATLAALALVITGMPAAAVEDVQPARVEGPTRLETAAAVARLSFPGGTAEAVVAGSTTFAGALAGSGLAGVLNAPVLLTTPDGLAATTLQALRDLGVERVTLAGGPSEVSATVESQLSQEFATTRIGGETTIATAAALARTAASIRGDLPTTNGSPSVLVASADDFADALTLSGPAHDGGFPLLLTEATRLSPEVRTALQEIAPETAVIAGGVEAVSAAVETEIQSLGITTVRLGGAERTATATVVADHFVGLGYFEARAPLLARGDNFPDALTAGALSAHVDSPILLTQTPTLLGDAAGRWFADNCPTIEVLQVVGGTFAVSTEVANQAEGFAEACGSPPPIPPATTQVYEVQPDQVQEVAAPGTVDFEVARRYDGQPLTGPVDLVLFPCREARVTGPDPDVFNDADGDGGADGFGTTDAGQARIAVVDGVDIEDDTVVVGVSPDADGDIDIRLSSQAADCTILVVVDGNGNGQLDVDADGHPIEPYGVSQTFWTG